MSTEIWSVHSAYVATGSTRAGLWGAFSAAVFWGIGTYFYFLRDGVGFAGTGLTSGQFAAKVAAHGAAGGVISELQGGSFGSGFVSAGATEALSPVIGKVQNPAARAVVAGAVGGTVSEATGGSFANGAETAFYASLFNQTVHDIALDNQIARWGRGEITTEQLQASENPCYGSASPGMCAAKGTALVVAGIAAGFVGLDAAALLSPEVFVPGGASLLAEAEAYQFAGTTGNAMFQEARLVVAAADAVAAEKAAAFSLMASRITAATGGAWGFSISGELAADGAYFFVGRGAPSLMVISPTGSIYTGMMSTQTMIYTAQGVIPAYNLLKLFTP